jgi:peroxiredoxin
MKLQMKTITSLVAFLALAMNAGADQLRDALDARKAEFEKTASAEKIEEYEKGIESVIASGMLVAALKVGDTAPDFTLKNTVGEEVNLANLPKNGPVVLTWYRGSWCPYCNIALQAYQRKLPEIQKAGAQFVALTPELPDKSLPTTEKFKLGCEVLTDLNNGVAEKFKIVFKMTPWVAKAMEDGFGLQGYNGKDYDKDTLPLSATYIITPDGKIAYVFLDAEYRRRATPEMIIAELGRLKKSE